MPMNDRTPRCPHSHPARGFTAIELLIALVLALSVSATALTLLQRTLLDTRAVVDTVSARQRATDAASILGAELRDASVIDTITMATDSAIELVTTVGASVVCALPTPTTIIVPPDTLASGGTLTSFRTPPDSNDRLTLFRPPSTADTTTGWSTAVIVSIARPAAAACPQSSRFTTAADLTAGRHAYSFTLAAPLPAFVHVGTPIRLLRRTRYSIYRGSDGRWYLGYRRCSPLCSTVQPVGGPYGAPNAPPISLKYFDATSAVVTPSTTPTTAIARVDVVARATTNASIPATGPVNSTSTDSAVATIALRNAP